MWSSHQGHHRQHNDAKITSLGSLLGVPVKLPDGIAEQKQQSNLHTQGDLLVSKLAVWVPCMENRAYQCSTGVVCWYSR